MSKALLERLAQELSAAGFVVTRIQDTQDTIVDRGYNTVVDRFTYCSFSILFKFLFHLFIRLFCFLHLPWRCPLRERSSHVVPKVPHHELIIRLTVRQGSQLLTVASSR